MSYIDDEMTEEELFATFLTRFVEEQDIPDPEIEQIVAENFFDYYDILENEDG